VGIGASQAMPTATSGSPRTVVPSCLSSPSGAAAGPRLHMHAVDPERLLVSPALGDERVSDDAGSHNRIRRGRAAAAGLRFGDISIVARAGRRASKQAAAASTPTGSA
jgi:hypothetical protein